MLGRGGATVRGMTVPIEYFVVGWIIAIIGMIWFALWIIRNAEQEPPS